jgi:carboxymethylenebutenolidase
MRHLAPFTACVLLVLGLGSGGEASSSDDRFDERIAKEHEGDAPVASGAAAEEPAIPVTAQAVRYATVDGREVQGYFARPKLVAGPLPGVIVIHEWWGLNDNIRSMTERLAGEGYAALAVDLYEGQVADDPDRARQLASASRNRVPAIQDNLRQARDYLAREVEAPKIGSIGWCFGGGWSLATAELLGDRIDAAVIYYGRLTSDPQRLLRVEAPILGIFGSEDRAISVESVREFEAALQKRGQPVEIHIYEGADHAFANPSGTRYDAEAAADAWRKTRTFLREHLRQ